MISEDSKKEKVSRNQRFLKVHDYLVEEKKIISSKELLGRVGAYPQYLRGYRDNSRFVTIEMLTKMSKLFKVDRIWLIDGLDEIDNLPVVNQDEAIQEQNNKRFPRIEKNTDTESPNTHKLTPAEEEEIKRIERKLYELSGEIQYTLQELQRLRRELGLS